MHRLLRNFNRAIGDYLLTHCIGGRIISKETGFHIDVSLSFKDVVTSSLLEEVLTLLRKFIVKGDQMSQALDDLADQVEEVKSVQQSAIVLIQGLHDQLVAAGSDPVKLAQLRADLKTSADSLAAAVVANTPGATP